MHAVLQNAYLLREIFDYVDSSYTHKKPCIIACALTCKTFLSPALDVLWRTMRPNIAPLMNLIPGIKRRIFVERGLKLETMYTEKPLLISDIDRLLHYACRVRNFVFLPPGFETAGRNSDAVDVDASLVLQLLKLLAGKPLMPALQDIHITFYTRDDRVIICSIYIQLLVSPSLKDVELYSYCHRDPGPEAYAPVAWHFIHSLTSIPDGKIQTLDLRSLPIPLNALTPIANLRSLRSLDICILVTSFTPDDIKHLFSYTKKLSKLEALTDLCFCFEGSTATPRIPRSATPVVSFEVLKHFWINGSIDMALWTMYMCRFPALHSLTIRPGYDTDPRAVPKRSWQQCLRSTLKNVGVTLRNISLDGGKKFPTEVSWLLFAPLLSFRKLTTLEFVELGIVSLSNDIISQMVTAWPMMSQLTIKSDHAMVSEANHVALLQIANGLPKLECLSICLSFAELSLELLEMDLKPNRNLEHLDITSPTGMPSLGTMQIYNIAVFLDALFPEVKRISFHNTAGGEHVEDMVKGLQDARRRERMRLGIINNVA